MLIKLSSLRHSSLLYYIAAPSTAHIQSYIQSHMCPWSTDAVISSTAIFVAIDNNALYESKLLKQNSDKNH